MGQRTPFQVGDAFEPEDLRSLGAAYDRAIEILMKTGEVRDPRGDVSELLAQRIIELGHCGQRDEVRIVIDALKFVRMHHVPARPLNLIQ